MKTFLFISPVDFDNANLTGAHRRYLELIDSVSQENKVIFISSSTKIFEENINIRLIRLYGKEGGGLPAHIDGMRRMIHSLMKMKKVISYDYAIAFRPSDVICYKICGYNRVNALFREDLINYLKAINTSNLKIRYFTIQERIAVKYADKIIVQCKNDRLNLILRNRKYCKNLEQKVYIQINNANASWMNNDVLQKAYIDDEITRILFIGEFSDERKGQGLLLPAVARLLDENYKIELYIAGSGKQLNNYKEKYKKYEQIHFCGRLKDISEYFSKCDFEIVPSLIDSCPNTILEGLNSGIAVYGSNTGGIPDLLEEEYLFEPSSDAIYEFIKNLIQTKRYRSDSEKQIALKDRLTFDWGSRIVNIIKK